MEFNINVSESEQVNFPVADANPYGSAGKRALDILGAVVGLAVFSPFIVIFLALVALDGANPIYGHKRVGRNGRIFKCWKIRSMVANADAALEKFLAENPDAAEEWAKDHKLTRDPRITRLGNFLRKTSLDELPQFWNVLVGDMSLVGPRPVTEDELKRYGQFATARNSVRPGITGLWQVSGRNEVSYSDRVAFDIEYLRTMSFKTDVKIMIATVKVMLTARGR